MTLKEIINGNEIVCNEDWFFKGYLGPLQEHQRGYEYAKKKMQLLLENKEFTLFNGEFWEKYGHEVLVCNVAVDFTGNGTECFVEDFFPEFKPA